MQDIRINLWARENRFGWHVLILLPGSGRDPHSTNVSPTVDGALADAAKYLAEYISPLDGNATDGTIKATLPERTPAQDSQSARAFLRLGPEPEPLTMGETPPCPACGFHNADACAIIGHTYPVAK